TFRQALLALVPEPLSPKGQALRLAACAADGLLLWLVYLAVSAVLNALFATAARAGLLTAGRAVIMLLAGLYFVVLEHAWGGSLVIQSVGPRQREQVPGSGGWLLSFLHSRNLNRGQAASASLPQRIAGFAIRGALKWTVSDKVLLGEDASLGRRVFLWLRSPG